MKFVWDCTYGELRYWGVIINGKGFFGFVCEAKCVCGKDL